MPTAANFIALLLLASVLTVLIVHKLEYHWSATQIVGYANEKVLNFEILKTIAPALLPADTEKNLNILEDLRNMSLLENSSKTEKTINETIYVGDAFLVAEDEIIIITIRECKKPFSLIASVPSNDSDDAIMRTYESNSVPTQKCPFHFAPKCSMIGHYEIVRSGDAENFFANFSQIPEQLMIGKAKDNDTMVPINLHDARCCNSSTKRKHRLGVCIPPVSTLADWTILAQFFETWIEHGATLFYITLESLTNEVDALLKIYENSANLTVVRLHWSMLPRTINGSEDDDDPNNHIFRSEQVTASDMCIFRARGHTRFLAVVDLDEIVVRNSSGTLLELLEATLLLNPETGAFIIRSSLVMLSNETWENVTHPREISFDGLLRARRENYTFPAGLQSKYIVIPERVFTSHVHTVLVFNQRFKAIVIDPDILRICHVRRLLPRKLQAELLDDVFDPELIDRWNKQWYRRLDFEMNRLKIIKPISLSLLDSEWPNRGQQVMQMQEDCYNKLFERRQKMCNSFYRCFDNVIANSSYNWLIAKQKWLAL